MFPSEDEDKAGVQQLNSETSSNSFWFLFSQVVQTKTKTQLNQESVVGGREG